MKLMHDDTNVTMTIFLSILVVCVMISVVSYHIHLTNVDSNARQTEIELDNNERRMEIELHGKRKIWERPMPNPENE